MKIRNALVSDVDMILSEDFSDGVGKKSVE